MKDIKLGSLFDGSAGFPLAGYIYGMTPVWASEIEPYPIRVTTKRLPFMKHYGDISKMNGAEIEPVDIMTGGSPCQDMSVAGKRAGLDGERSGLFREQIRIIKEMREATNGQYPRYMVWENVPGALSSNKEQISDVCLKRQRELKTPPLMFLCQRKINGIPLDLSWEMISPSDGESWTLNTGEFPKDVEESFLSQILVVQAPEKYYLSEKACLGILRRAEKRGKQLPEILRQALMKQAGIQYTA